MPPLKFRFSFGKSLILTFFSLFFISALYAQTCQPVTFYVDAPEDVSGVGNRYRITVRADINASNQTTFQLSGILLSLTVNPIVGTSTIVAGSPVAGVTGSVTGSGNSRQFSLFIGTPGNPLNIADNGGLFFIEVTGVPLSELRITLSQGLVAPPTAVYTFRSNGVNTSCNQGTLGGTTVNNGITTIRPTFVDCTIAAATLYGATKRPGGDCEDGVAFVNDIQMTVSQLTPAPVQVATFTTNNQIPFWEYSGVPSGNYRVTAQLPTGPFSYTFHAGGLTESDPNAYPIPLSDLELIRLHILGIQPLAAVWQYYAADATGDKLVTTFDIVQIRKLINGDPGWANLFPPWELIPEPIYNEAQDRLDNDLNPLQTTPTNWVTMNNLQEGDQAIFYAIKNGDVDGSSEDCSPFINIVSAPEDRDFTEGNTTILFPKLKGKAGDILNIPILSGVDNNCFYLGMALRFDPAYMEVVSTKPSDRFGISVVEGNSVVYTYLDVDDLEKPGLIKTDQGLFTVKVKLLRDIDAISEYVSFDNDRISHVWLGDPFNKSFLKLETTQGSDLSSSLQLWPNPAHTNLMLTIDTPAEAVFTAFATDGKLVHSQNIGENRSIDIAQLLPGIYTYSIVNGDQVTSGRFVKQ